MHRVGGGGGVIDVRGVCWDRLAAHHLCFLTSSAPALRPPSRLVRSAVRSFLTRSLE